MSDQEVELGPALVADVRKNTRITPESTDEVRHIVLHISEPSFRYTEGQSIGVVVPGPHAFGNKYHMRRYSIANDRTVASGEGIDVSILVRRCFYIDEVNGERYPGIASNYLCDAPVGKNITITGPYRSPFNTPSDPETNLLMIGTGTGIAPFRAFIRQIYSQKGSWKGQVRLFYGARTGMDLLYMNDQNNDLANYYDEETFKVFSAIAGRPLASETDAVERSLSDNIEEAWNLIQSPDTHVFLAGLTKVQQSLNRVLEEAAGSEDAWKKLKNRMIDEGRWSELLYS